MKAITKDLVNSNKQNSLRDSLNNLVGKFEVIQDKIDAMERNSKEGRHDVRAAVVEKTEAEDPPAWVVNLTSGTTHKVMLGGTHNPPPSDWRTVCGWRYGVEPHQACKQPGTNVACKKCLRRASISFFTEKASDSSSSDSS